MWFGVILVVVLIVIVWWLLNQNAQQAKDEVQADPHSEIVLDTPADEEPEVVVEAEAPQVEDDLAVIEGIGPKIKSILYAAGIKSFAKLAEYEPEAIKDILTEAGLRLGDPTSWPAQAKLAADGNMDALDALQDKLKGGRVVED